MFREAASIRDPDRRAALARWAVRSEGTARLEAMLVAARSEPGVAVRADELDADPELFNTAGGTIDTRTATVREPRRGDLITRAAPVVYDPDATRPVFDAFLARVQPREDVRAFLQRAAGYCLTGLTVERVLFVPHGNGRNGKSTLLELLRDVVGEYAAVAPVELLLARRDPGIPNDLARLKGARFVTTAETEEGRRPPEGSSTFSDDRSREAGVDRSSRTSRWRCATVRSRAG
jgi:putative DNA primase/helicase